MPGLPKDEPEPVAEPVEATDNKLTAPAGWEPTFPADAPTIQVKFDIRDFEGPLDLLLHLIR